MNSSHRLIVSKNTMEITHINCGQMWVIFIQDSFKPAKKPKCTFLRRYDSHMLQNEQLKRTNFTWMQNNFIKFTVEQVWVSSVELS